MLDKRNYELAELLRTLMDGSFIFIIKIHCVS
jgi:hypothetical protein